MKILLAEDDPVTREAVAACLLAEDFRVVPAENGREALGLWKTEKPDLICLDIMMPEMDGYEVCRRIRASGDPVPILFLSAKNEEIDVVVGLELGADDFVRKPFGRHELLARVRAALLPHRYRRSGKRGTNTSLLCHGSPHRLPERAPRRKRKRRDRPHSPRGRDPHPATRAARRSRSSRHHPRPVLGPRILPRVPHPRSAHRQAPQENRNRPRQIPSSSKPSAE